jgi:hypothetical protein
LSVLGFIILVPFGNVYEFNFITRDCCIIGEIDDASVIVWVISVVTGTPVQLLGLL